MMQRYVLENVVRRYRQSRGAVDVDVLRLTRLEVSAGEILAVVGANGSGKSTLLETMAFLNRPDEGRVLLDGRDVWADRSQLDARRRCPMLLQKTVLFRTTVIRNVMYPLRLRGVPRREARRRASVVLRAAGLEALAQRNRRELSGGERRRVALARILALKPAVLLLDEPTAHVDRANARLIEDAVRDLHARGDMTVVIATHNISQAFGLADRVVTLVDGILFPGTMDNLFTGTLRAQDNAFTFRADSGLLLRVPAPALAPNADQAPPPADRVIQIAVDPRRMSVVPAGAPAAGALLGAIVSIRQRRDRCYLRVSLASARSVHVEISVAEYNRLNLNLGAPVRLDLGQGAVRIIPAPARRHGRRA